MTRKTATPLEAVGSYSVQAGQADWAWIPSTEARKTGNVFSKSFNLPVNTPNPQNIELESGSIWVKATVIAESLQLTDKGDTRVNFQIETSKIPTNTNS